MNNLGASRSRSVTPIFLVEMATYEDSMELRDITGLLVSYEDLEPLF